MNYRRFRCGLVVVVLLAVSTGLAAQETLEALLQRIPKAPPGVPVPPLPERPVRYHTAEGQEIEVSVVARGLDHPYSLAILPGGTMLVSERDKGRLRVIRNGVLDPTPVAGLPAIKGGRWMGLLDVVPHPKFASNRQIYISYDKAIDADATTVAVLRGTWDGKALTNARDIFVAGPGVGGSSRLLFDGDGHLFVSLYGNGDEAQKLTELRGKVLRLTEDGKPAPGNPFLTTANARPEIYSYGHRTIQALIRHPETNAIWSLEMGPNGGDEIDVLKPGANYGWPIVSLGRNYAGPWQTSTFDQDGYEKPIVYWMPSISVSGMTFYTGNKLPLWQGDLFVGGLRMGEIPGTGHLQRVRFNANGEEIRREQLLIDLRQRIRGAYQGDDGYLYVLTDEDDGAILRIGPAS